MSHTRQTTGRGAGTRPLPAIASMRSSTRPTRLRLAGVTVLAASLAFVSACGSGSDDNGSTPAAGDSAAAADVLGPIDKATGAPVRIGVITEGASPTADHTNDKRVIPAVVEYLNEHKGGIGGRPIEVTVCETLSDLSKAADCGNQLVDDGVSAVLIGTSAVVEAAWKPLNDAKVPVMLYSSGEPALLASPTTFVLGNPTFGFVELAIQVAKDAGNKKVSAIVVDVPAALHSAQEVAPPLFQRAGIGYELVRVAPGTADMTPQMQQVVANGSDQVFIIGNDAFCISAMNGLGAVGFTGTISGISQCITDATRKSVLGDTLKGMVISASAPVGPDSPSMRLFTTVAETYGKDIDLSNQDGMIMFMLLAGLQTATQGITGDITPVAITSTIKAMKETELPGGGGIRFRCNGKAVPDSPAVCVRGGLSTTLDDKGQPAEYKVLGTTPIPN
ncbi:ABC transporter substrate-binding protein [Frankia sp. CNm7]|uniref:ABC transporter substrate-binding protein n=1 Tax=Frankia nepalensis TaxID=1836974 RepID=A0A937RID4_9ACTN|nr:ABC transporter substrate-binding protein [Frankia nepalensis]MBL7499663.1 ABC transporter substrate-binding protein [Frankia nepalensis]MBL7514635.1 ABC transporter substrate-binding protein [Frankia nepalensis]MBL7522618.1 ABC transporter substrate-binding protein [Frankia nepalensis]MBL7629389.1 ABC transporter substrate-binding protein [Frankia nepalensis]